MQHLRFLDATIDRTLALPGSYDPVLVVLSIAMASLAAYAVFGLGERISAAENAVTRRLWLIAGALSMGLGVWSMHFIGMLAFTLPVPISYDILMTLFSMLPAALASSLMLTIISRARLQTRPSILAGTLMGIGIVAMHYTGMAAMRLPAEMFYDPVLLIASTIVAILFSILAFLHTTGIGKRKSTQYWRRVGAASTMGLAISGMHYTAMMAVYFFPTSGAEVPTNGLNPSWLALLVGLATALILGLVIFLTMVDTRLKDEQRQGRQTEQERDVLALAVESTDDVIFMTDKEGRITYANPAFERVYGFSCQEALGKTPRILKSGKMSKEYFEKFWAKILGGKAFKGEFINRAKDGQIVIAEATVNPIIDANGDVTGFINVQKDLTEHQQRDNDLQLYRSLLDHSADAIFVVDPKTFRFLDFNDRACGITGYTREDLLALSVIDIPSLFPDLAHWRQHVEKLRQTEHMLTQRKAGESYWIEANTSIVSLEGVEYMLLIVRDITYRKEVEEALQESEERHRSVVESAPSAVIVVDEDIKIISWNRSAQHSFGYEAEEVKDKSVALLVPERYRETFLRRLNQPPSIHQTRHNGGQMELHGLKKDGSEFPAEVLLSSWQTQTGRYFSAIIRDLTQQKNLEQQLLQSQKMEAIGVLAAGVAHDFNNILTGINGLASLALEELESDASSYEDVSEIRELGNRAAGLTRQLLSFSRQQPLEPIRLSLNSLIQLFMKMLSRVIGEDIELTFRPNADLDTVRADPGQIEQVLMNLAVNSRDSMPQGGVLTIQTDRVDLDRGLWSTTGMIQAGPYVTVTVSDTGCGMDEGTCRHVFDPFYTTKGVGEGTGLGLATVYGIVTQHEGYIVAKSTPGEGTSFKIYLPRVAGPPKEPATEVEVESPSGEPATILLVEDDKTVRTFVDRVLKKHGYKIFSASDPAEAERLFSEHYQKIGLMLTDIVMRGRNGADLYEMLVEKQPQLKVLFMSGYINKGVLTQKVLEPGLPFLQKPFDENDLVKKVQEVWRAKPRLGPTLMQ